MTVLPLDVLPNQEFSMVADGNIYRLTVYTVDTENQVMCMDFNINGVDVYLGAVVQHGVLMLPWPSLQMGGGNFMFYAPEDFSPWWQNFGTTNALYYLAPADLVVTV